jgi:acyl-CoA synthetase (AMP-forming)/AMP-acid ligase II
MVVNPDLPAVAVERRVAQVGARLVVDAERAPALRDPRRAAPAGRPRPEDIAFLQLTSGTTGESRAAAVSHEALVVYLRAHTPLPGDVLVSWMPLHHDFGLVRFMFQASYFGLPCHLLPPALTSLGRWLRTITEVRGTMTGAPDFAYRLAARSVSPDGIDLGSLRIANNGGEPVRASTIALFEERFRCPGAMSPGYGLAEATLGVSSVSAGEPVVVDARGAVSVGRPRELTVRIARGGVALPAGEIGDIELAGRHLFSGYWRAGGGLDRSPFTDDGWLRTGDTGYLDQAGRLYVLGRTRAMVKQAAALIAPREVEEVVDRVPGVRLSAAIGMPGGPSGGEELVVVIEGQPDEAEVVAAVRAALGVAPGRVLRVPPRTIPLTHNGKIRHAALRETLLVAGGRGGA